VFGCNSSLKEIEDLKNENKYLQEQILALKEQSNDFAFRATVITNKSELKVGEDYIADVRLAVVNKNEPPRVILCNIVDGVITDLNDTLPYNDEYQSSVYHLKTNRPGTFEWSGIIVMSMNGTKQKYPFSMVYKVTN